jgi:hypothetical protein
MNNCVFHTKYSPFSFELHKCTVWPDWVRKLYLLSCESEQYNVGVPVLVIYVHTNTRRCILCRLS